MTQEKTTAKTWTYTPGEFSGPPFTYETQDSLGGYIVPDSVILSMVAAYEDRSIYRLFGAKPISWEERLRREVAYRSIRSRLRRARFRLVREWPAEAHARLSLAADALLGRHDCGDDW